jgi:tetratricopeptide (TPR) repeat protein
MSRQISFLLAICLALAGCTQAPPTAAPPTTAALAPTAAPKPTAPLPTDAPQPTNAPTEAPVTNIAPLYDNLGDHTHPITTREPSAQRYFDQGLTLTYAFNHEEAIRSFEEAARIDPNCAMCFWGKAYALGPNINAPMAPEAVAPAYEALEQARKLSSGASDAEQAYIKALTARYAPDPDADRAALDKAFAEAMRTVMDAYPDDADAATIYAEALMNLTPWNYWTKDGQPTEFAEEIVTTLEAVLTKNPEHPGANHYYIHAVEASQDPGRALPSANRLETLVPGAGHLVHMPAHIYWRVGQYQDAVEANQHAIHSDESYLPDRPAPGWYPIAYYPHNIHFLFAAASMSGQSELAISAARKLVDEVPESAYNDMPPIEDFLPMPIMALTRFGKWDEVLAEPKPDEQFQYSTGVWHYARGLALVRTGKLAEAEAELRQLDALAQKQELKDLVLFSFSPAATNLTLAAHTLRGELAGARGDHATQIAELTKAVEIQDGFAYIEPPVWYYPVRQSLGAALLDADKPAEAEAVYRADLKEHPNNGWSLFGLSRSLEAQNKHAEAQEAQEAFRAAWEHADVELSASQF